MESMASTGGTKGETLRGMLTQMTEEGFGEVLRALKGVTETEAKVAVTKRERELVTDGTVLGIVRHIITAKVTYRNSAFEESCLIGHWDAAEADVTSRTPTLKEATALLHEAHAAWVAGWFSLSDAELAGPTRVHLGEKRPAWGIIHHFALHDAYHAGQMVIVAGVVRERLMNGM